MLIRRSVLSASAALAVACTLAPNAVAVAPLPMLAGARPVADGRAAPDDDTAERPGWDRIRGQLGEAPWVLEDGDGSGPADDGASPADDDVTPPDDADEAGPDDATGRVALDDPAAVSRSTARDARRTWTTLLERIAVARRSPTTPLVPARPTWPGFTFPA